MAIENQPGPSSCLPDRLFVLILPSTSYGRGSMEEDVWVHQCMSNLQSEKTPPAGLSHSLPDPLQPWSQTSLDFITGVSPLQGSHRHPHDGRPVHVV